jgi:hypothetical protein
MQDPVELRRLDLIDRLLWDPAVPFGLQRSLRNLRQQRLDPLDDVVDGRGCRGAHGHSVFARSLVRV